MYVKKRWFGDKDGFPHTQQEDACATGSAQKNMPGVNGLKEVAPASLTSHWALVTTIECWRDSKVPEVPLPYIQNGDFIYIPRLPPLIFI